MQRSGEDCSEGHGRCSKSYETGARLGIEMSVTALMSWHDDHDRSVPARRACALTTLPLLSAVRLLRRKYVQTKPCHSFSEARKSHISCWYTKCSSAVVVERCFTEHKSFVETDSFREASSCLEQSTCSWTRWNSGCRRARARSSYTWETGSPVRW